MQWTNAALEKLITLYRSHPCLYNNRMKEYRDQPAKKQAYQFIMNNLQDVRKGTTVEDIKSKINSLRSGYSQDYAKMNTNPKYKSNKWYFPLLDAFLKDFTRNASKERNRSASRESVPELDSTVDGDNTRDSFLRSNMSTPLSFYGVHIGRESPIFVSRGRSGFPSPTPSLYGQEAEPFMGEDVPKPLESKSCESVSSDGAPFFLRPKTLSGIDPSIFDQPTLSEIEISPVPSPAAIDSGVFEQNSVRLSFVPSPNVSPIPKDNDVFKFRSDSPAEKLFKEKEEVGAKKEQKTQVSGVVDESERDLLPGPSTSKDRNVQDVEELSGEVQPGILKSGQGCSASKEEERSQRVEGKKSEPKKDVPVPLGPSISKGESVEENVPGPSGEILKTKEVHVIDDDPQPTLISVVNEVSRPSGEILKEKEVYVVDNGPLSTLISVASNAPVPSGESLQKKEVPAVDNDAQSTSISVVSMPGPSGENLKKKEVPAVDNDEQSISVVNSVPGPSGESLKKKEVYAADNVPQSTLVSEVRRSDCEDIQPGPSKECQIILCNKPKNSKEVKVKFSEPKKDELPGSSTSRDTYVQMDVPSSSRDKTFQNIEIQTDDSGPSTSSNYRRAQTGTLKRSQSSHEQSSVKRKPYKTICYYYDDDSESEEYFSAEEDFPPVNKRRKITHVSHHYYHRSEPQKLEETEDDVFANLIRMKLKGTDPAIKPLIHVKLMSAFLRD